MSRHKYRDLSKNTILFTISNFGTKIISFLLVPLYTSILSTNDYGTADLMTTTAQLLIPVLTLNIQDAVLRFALDKNYSAKETLKVSKNIIFLSSLCLAIALYFLCRLNIITLDSQYIVFLFLSFLVGSLSNSVSMYLKAEDKVGILVISGLTNTLITCVLNICLLLFLRMGMLGYLFANIAGSAVGVGIMICGGKIVGDFLSPLRRMDKKLALQMVSFSAPLVVNSIAWWLNNASDRYILTFFAGTVANGIYSVSYKVPTILSTLQSIFYSAWSISAITEFDKDDHDGFMGNVYMTYACGSILGCSCLLIFNQFIAHILYAKEFYQAWQFTPPLLVGTVFNGIALFEGCIFTAVKDTKSVTISTLVGSGINTLLNFILIPFWGAEGAALATLVGYLCVWIVRTIQVKKIVRMKVNWLSQVVSLAILVVQMLISMKGQHLIQVPFLVLLIIMQHKYMRKVFSMLKTRIFRR